jgi:hypothetical protein
LQVTGRGARTPQARPSVQARLGLGLGRRRGLGSRELGRRAPIGNAVERGLKHIRSARPAMLLNLMSGHGLLCRRIFERIQDGHPLNNLQSDVGRGVTAGQRLRKKYRLQGVQLPEDGPARRRRAPSMRGQ